MEHPQAEQRAYPSPEQGPSPILLTTGPEMGTQIDRVVDLRADALFLDLGLAADKDASPRAATLLHCAWHPRDPTILAGAGTDALARMWTFQHAPVLADACGDHVMAIPSATDTAPADGSTKMAADGAEQVPPQVNGDVALLPLVNGLAKQLQAPSSRDMLDRNAPPTTTSTAMCWASDGSNLLIANEPVEDALARIDIYAPYGMRVTSLDGFESPIIYLRWNFSNTLILVLSPYKNTTGTMVSVVHAESQSILRYPLPNHDLGEQPLDVVWTTDEDFIICGGDILQALHAGQGGITPIRKYEVHDDHPLSKISFDWPSQLLATSSDLGKIDVWDKDGQCRSLDAHQGLITSLIWQPMPMQGPKLLDNALPRLLASAGEDGAISIWDARSPDTKPQASMTMRSAVLALAFTPDGEYIAGATNEEVLIWKVDDVVMPRACWSRAVDNGWQTPLSRDSTPEEDHYCLCWDAEGRKLAYGVNNLVCQCVWEWKSC